MGDCTVAADDRSSARDELLENYLPLAEQLARRFRNRGEPLDDLVQVARLGLIKSVDGFDPDRGVDFTSYAIPTISGELKRHFRDKGWSVRVPRRLKDLRLDIAQAILHLTQHLGRTPTVADVAAHLEISEAGVREAMVSAQAYSATSLSTPVGPETAAGDTTLGDTLGGPDDGMRVVEDREMLRPLLGRLAPRERRIIGMRFYENMTQSQIAAQVGISQMHVSRLLTRSLQQMREGLASTV
ncbi:MAG: RNA polymerase sigma factor SigF [Geodermatophilaceae bacterium]|nr:RNA polymerase sigma factor SigF [Geodermatophilaceae bacterium]